MKNQAKIFVYDVETSPNLAHVWGMWQQNVSINQIMEPGRVIMWAGKWLGEKTIYSMDEIEHGRKAMVRGLWDKLNEADIIVGHNVSGFDNKWASYEFLREGLEPPNPSKDVDTLKVVRQRFRFPSNKLDYICKALGLGGKVPHTGHSLWVGWLNGDPECHKTMVKYCKQDVRITEKLYLRIRGWIKNHPALHLYSDEIAPTCPNCGSKHVVRNGLSYTVAGVYQRYRCSNSSCKAPLRGKVLEQSHKDKRRDMLTQDK